MPWEMRSFEFCLENLMPLSFNAFQALDMIFSFETSKLCIDKLTWSVTFFCRLNRLKRRHTVVENLSISLILHKQCNETFWVVFNQCVVVGHRCRVFWGAFWKTQVKIFKEVIELKGKCYREMKSSRRWLSIYKNNGAEREKRILELLLISKIFPIFKGKAK